MASEGRHFRVDLRLLRELGERLISRDEVAVVELVKNAYDADATSVDVLVGEDSLEVNDNGNGMAEQEITDGWLTIGTGTKVRNPRTLRGRRVLGEKGLGRLSLLRLGKKITITTQMEGNRCYQLVMDWGHAERKLRAAEFTPLDELELTVSEVDKTPFASGHGTRLVVEALRADWSRPKIQRLGVFLSRLIDPRGDHETEFEIRLIAGGEKVPLDPPEVTQKPHYSMHVGVDGNGGYVGKIGWASDGKKEKRPIKGEFDLEKRRGPRAGFWKVGSDDGAGPFEMSIKVWDQTSQPPSRSGGKHL